MIRAVFLLAVAGYLLACGQPDTNTTAIAPTSLVAYPLLNKQVDAIPSRTTATVQPIPDAYPSPGNAERYTPIPSNQPTPIRNEDGSILVVPTVELGSLPAPDQELYALVLNDFFADNTVQQIIQAPFLTQTLVAIQPPVSERFPSSLVTTVTTMIQQQPLLATFTLVGEPQPGGLLISFSELTHDGDWMPGPTISMSISVVDNDCIGGFIGHSYLIQHNERGWLAQKSGSTMC